MAQFCFNEQITARAGRQSLQAIQAGHRAIVAALKARDGGCG